MKNTARPPGRRMVSWFDPIMLVMMALRAAFSALIGRQADRRLLDALEAPMVEPSDFSVDATGRPREELWFDYVADLGDGWNSTYSVALAVSRKTLTLRDAAGSVYETSGGEILVFGGDAVYPVASVNGYEQRTLRPYAAALRGQRPPPHLFAIPGNHDWYDGLTSFVRLFCQTRHPAGFPTRQRRSYFAVKLPHGWWLLGTDMQLESDIDAPQVRYFQAIAALMREEDRIILCHAEPAWLCPQVRPPGDRTDLENNVEFLQSRVLGKKVSVFLAGDLHHYRRHENPEGRQKIIAGGGGAFLHPTHIPRKEQPLADDFTPRACFPSVAASRRICWRNLGFLWKNPRFGVFTGIVYVLLAWPLMKGAGAGCAPGAPSPMRGAALLDPVFLLVTAALTLCLVGFADRRFGRFRGPAGLLHGLTHSTAAILIAWGTTRITRSVPGLPFPSPQRDLLDVALLFFGGFLMGPTIMGIYLLVSLNGFGAHPNEAFSSLSIPDWKNFLRIHIDRDGRLWIFPIGIRRVPRAWRPATSVEEPEWVADAKDRRATPPALIEPPIVVETSEACPATTAPPRDAPHRPIVEQAARGGSRRAA
ncbi:calcineurin [Polyangium sp. y55x31]|uniref:calcineurin n=1 Tax=Polyangium sp. y55x31 TaxID=3042688 RepID=UPI0024829AEB|nr:calcineurin [Polyangium sp. y55x31]MDI1483403.1 calcineurin [Polyangium sp. y55x31]